MVKSTSCKVLKGYVREEMVAARDYRKRGFHVQARQEASHAKFFKKKLKRC